MRKQMNVVLFFIFCFLINSAGHAQIDKILKAGGKMLDKSPTKLMEKYFSNAPITTSFDDVKTEVMLLANFDPPENYFSSLWDLEQNENGDYIVTEGLYSGFNKSFCMKAGTYGPSQGDGHLYATLAGPKAYLVRKILENWLPKNPDIPQRDVQCLIWAIIARTDVDKMKPEYTLTLARLLDKEDMAKLAANSLKDKALEAGMEKLRGEIPADVYKVFQAERNLRNMYSKADTRYEQFEQMAVLAGIAPPADMIRPVSKARWSWHPNGYFIRLTPHGYSSTKVDVYIPLPVEAETDALGRIKFLSHNGTTMVEFAYDKNNIAKNEMVNSSGITEIVLLNNGIVKNKPFKIQPGLAPGFVKKDFMFEKNSGTNGTQLRQFTEWLHGEKGSLVLQLDQSAKSKLFNLASAIQSLETLPEQVMQSDMNAYLRYMLNEAYNYSIYKDLSINERTGIRKKNENPGKEQWVIYALPLKNSGPQTEEHNNDDFSNRNMINPSSWFSQDRGLDLPNTVATPANRSSQRIGQSKPPKDKPWYEKLPPCPCTYTDAQNLAKKKGSGWMDCGAANQTYHYGGVTEVRWAPTKPGMPGQQCTYDSQGNLITSGIGAGSPDKNSPQGCGTGDGISWNEIRNFPGHKTKDMDTWESMPCWKYLRDWPANNENGCSSNPVNDLKHMKDLFGKKTCREITEMLQQAEKSKQISGKLKDFLQGKPDANLSGTELIQELNKWVEKEGLPGQSHLQPGK